MNRQWKDMLLFDDDEIYAETKRRIEECGEKKGKKLDLSTLDLKEIPPEIAELQSLEELYIPCLSLEKVPGFIGNIVSLKKLSVGYPGQHGQEKIILPAELGNLHNLRNLSLGCDIPEIPSWVWALDNLEALSIYNNSIESIPVEISDMKRLRKLRIHCEKIATLPEEIGEKLSLTVLDLQCPRLEALPDSFANLKTMKCLLFTLCNLTAIPGYICDLTNLEEFASSMANSFQGTFTKLNTIPRNIGNLKKLKYLSLDGVNIAKIPDSLGNCPLQYLELSGNFSIVPETLGNCSKLKTLKLSSGKPIRLPEGFGKLSSLRKLEISAPTLEILESFGKLALLEELCLQTEDMTLPKNFGGLSALKDFLLVAKKMRDIPDSIGNCKNLKRITIDSDKLTALPESFCKLKNLQELHLNTFALKELPIAFGNLTSLKYIDIFSGALTVLPESLGGLKELVNLSIDAHNVKKLPDSFRKLSYIKNLLIQTGQSEPVLPWKRGTVKKSGSVSFEELSTMSWQYRGKLFGTYSIKQLETLLRSAPQDSIPTRKDKELFKDIMLERRCKLKSKFKWTEENKKRIAKVSDEFLKAWEDGIAKAKLISEALYKKEKDKNSFQDKYNIDIILYPDILFSGDDKRSDWKLYNVITRYLYNESELNMHICYNPVTKNVDSSGKDIHIKKELSWNIEGLGDIELEGYYICYALHILYSHNNWTLEDILRINSVVTEIKVNCDGESFRYMRDDK